MARRRGELIQLMQAASTWDWKISAALVPICFLSCRILAAATTQPALAATPANLGPLVIQQGIHAFASILQYVMPLIFLIAASVSLIKRSRSRQVFEHAHADPDFTIESLSWQAFESLVAEGFKHRGFDVRQRGGAGSDGGVDLALARGHERFLVQCKHWRARQVGVAVVRELYGVMAAENVAGGYVVTSGAFTKNAKSFAAGRNIELIDGATLSSLLRDGQSSPTSNGWPAPLRDTLPVAPACPNCGSSMVLRTAKRGAHVGRSFWGCPRYPRCQSIVARE